MTTCFLSILIISLEKRKQSLQSLIQKLNNQITTFCTHNNISTSVVEILVNVDNGENKIGTKRNLLLKQVKGYFFTFIDDDDDVSDDYIYRLLFVADQSPTIHVFSFQQTCSLDNGKTSFIVNADMNNKIDDYIPLHTTTHEEMYQRHIWHWCMFNSNICKHVMFDDMNDGEDYKWLLKIRPLLKTQCHLNKPLYIYTTSPITSACSYFK